MTLFTYVIFSQSGGKPDNRDEGFHPSIMYSSVDEVKEKDFFFFLNRDLYYHYITYNVKEKDIAFLPGNFDNVCCSKTRKV